MFWNKKLLFIAEKYCIIDVRPYLECKLVIPNIIFSELIIPIYGRWYKPASGLYTLLSDINKVMINELSNKNFKNFKLKNLFLSLNIIIKLINGNNDDISKFKGKKN